MFDATTPTLMLLCALRPFRVYQAIIWHYSNTGRLPDMSVPHKRPERTVEPPQRTRHCCFLFLGWPEQNNGREWTSLRRRVGLALHSILISGMQNRRNNTSSVRSVCPALPVKESLTPELSGQWSKRSDIRYYANRSSFTGGLAQSELIKWCEK